MILDIVLSLVLAVPLSLSTFPHILQLQLCEYLLYRYRALVEDKGIAKALLFTKFRFPAKSIRNLMILGLTYLLTVSFFLLAFTYLESAVAICIALFLSYPVSKVFVLLGALITSPLSSLYRARYLFIANRQLKSSGVKIIAITGSYGKSSVKEYLHRILSAKYLTGKTRGNRNTEVGIAIEIGLQITRDMDYFIAEMGAYRRHDIEKLCKLYKPSIGIITGVGNQHVSLFGSRQELIKTKLELVDGVKHGSVYASLEWDGAVNAFSQYHKKIVTYGFGGEADVKVVFGEKAGRFKILHGAREEEYESKLLGMHSYLNLVPAIIVSRELGMSYHEVYEIVKAIEPITGKLSLHKVNKGMTVLNDSYNSNVDGFCSAIDVLDCLNSGKKYISTLGIFELGNEKYGSYKRIVKALEGKNILLLTTDADFFGESASTQVRIFKQESEILKFLNGINEEKVLLVEGRHSPAFMTELGISKAY